MVSADESSSEHLALSSGHSEAPPRFLPGSSQVPRCWLTEDRGADGTFMAPLVGLLDRIQSSLFWFRFSKFPSISVCTPEGPEAAQNIRTINLHLDINLKVVCKTLRGTVVFKRNQSQSMGVKTQERPEDQRRKEKEAFVEAELHCK